MAQKAGIVDFHYMSSTTIFGWNPLPVAGEDDANVRMTGLTFGYAQSKWVAEQLVAAAGGRGMNAFIYRPAFLSASSNAVLSPDDIVVRLFAFMIKNELAVLSINQLSLLPVDFAADSIAAVVARAASPCTMNITADYY